MATINSGATALSIAGERGHTDIVTYLLEILETVNPTVLSAGTRQSAPFPATYAYLNPGSKNFVSPSVPVGSGRSPPPPPGWPLPLPAHRAPPKFYRNETNSRVSSWFNAIG